jgi:hypothetical protein
MTLVDVMPETIGRWHQREFLEAAPLTRGAPSTQQTPE